MAALLRQFRSCFPDIVYEALPEVPAANAQAVRTNGKRHVRIYGGLIRHRLVGSAGLAVALAHETGHHLGGEPRLPYLPWLSDEDKADEWARDVGLPLVFAARASAIWRRGARELNAISAGT